MDFKKFFFARIPKSSPQKIFLAEQIKQNP